MDRVANCTKASSQVECLRKPPLEAPSAALNTIDTRVYSGTGIGPRLTVPDRDFFTGIPTNAIRKGNFVKVPILYGATTDESTNFGPSGISTDAKVAAVIANDGPDNATIATLANLYPNNNAVGCPCTYDRPLRIPLARSTSARSL